MEQSDAIAMLRHPALNDPTPATWADLGSGSGVFTRALAHLLPAGSRIFAVDTDQTALGQIPKGGIISTIIADFTQPLSLPALNGILMANSVHYVSDKFSFIEQVKQYLQPGGYLMMVEYDLTKGNPWVPYPLGFSAMQDLLLRTGFTAPEKIGERRSVYNKSVMYSCISHLA